MTYTQTRNQRYPLKARVKKRGHHFRFTIYNTDPEHDKTNIASGTATTPYQALKQANTRMKLLRARR